MWLLVILIELNNASIISRFWDKSDEEDHGNEYDKN